MMMFDQLGYPVEVGDEVFYAMGGKSDTSIRKGVVKEITLYHNELIAKIAKNQNGRPSHQILSTKYFIPLDDVKQQFPEHFI